MARFRPFGRRQEGTAREPDPWLDDPAPRPAARTGSAHPDERGPARRAVDPYGPDTYRPDAYGADPLPATRAASSALWAPRPAEPAPPEVDDGPVTDPFGFPPVPPVGGGNATTWADWVPERPGDAPAPARRAEPGPEPERPVVVAAAAARVEAVPAARAEAAEAVRAEPAPAVPVGSAPVEGAPVEGAPVEGAPVEEVPAVRAGSDGDADRGIEAGAGSPADVGTRADAGSRPDAGAEADARSGVDAESEAGRAGTGAGRAGNGAAGIAAVAAGRPAPADTGTGAAGSGIGAGTGRPAPPAVAGPALPAARPALAPAVPPPPDDPPDPAEAAALAGAFAADYLSWDEDDPARRGRALADHLTGPAGALALLGWSGAGRQRAEIVLPGAVRPDGDGRLLVDVRVRVTPYRRVSRSEATPEPEPQDTLGTPAAAPPVTARGWRGLAARWVRLGVTVVRDGDRLVVDAGEETFDEPVRESRRPRVAAAVRTVEDPTLDGDDVPVASAR